MKRKTVKKCSPLILSALVVISFGFFSCNQKQKKEWLIYLRTLVGKEMKNGKKLSDTQVAYIESAFEELHPNHHTATSYNIRRIQSKGLIKAYNTLTAGFQWRVGSDSKHEEVVMPYSRNTEEAKTIVAELIRDNGFVPYDVGDSEMARFIEPPRESTSLYGEEWPIDTIEKRLKELKDNMSV